MFELFKYNPPVKNTNTNLGFSNNNPEITHCNNEEYMVSENIDINIENMKKVMHLDKNGDIVMRTFNWQINSGLRKGVILFADGIVNRNSINQFVLMPLMNKNHEYNGCNIIEFMVENIMPQNQTTYETSVNKIAASINFGNAGIFIDGCDKGVIIDIKTWEHRTISTPLNESVVQGPHEGFNEILRCNTAIIRTTVNNSDLVFETLFFGSKTQTPASLAYIDGVINEELLKNIKNKLSDIKSDYIFSVYDIEKYIEERKNITLPQIITTERPDKVCRALVEGRAALLLNGNPHALILPSNITDIIASPEDAYLRRPYSVFIRFIRIFAVVLSLLTPALYVAITRYHTESLLTDMMISLISARGGVPFSTLTEIIIMELSFELIKEASIRIPGSIGSSLGIVGGLILGQAAVSAGLVSPLIIILVSVCGIASFAIPSYSLSFSFRISRFAYIFAGGYFGILGIASVLFCQLALALSTQSFGVPFFVPFSPQTIKHPFLKSLFMDFKRIPNPNYLKSNRSGD